MVTSNSHKGIEKMLLPFETDDVIQSTEGAAAWRHKRSPDEPGCYTGSYTSITLPNSTTVAVPICKNVTSVGLACISSMANNNNQRKCVQSRSLTMKGVTFHTHCSCAA